MGRLPRRTQDVPHRGPVVETARSRDEAGASGAYFLYGKRGAQNREKIEGWALQLKGEVLERMEKLKDINQQAYDQLVDETASRYGRTKRVSAHELKHLTAEMKNAWSHISKQ